MQMRQHITRPEESPERTPENVTGQEAFSAPCEVICMLSEDVIS